MKYAFVVAEDINMGVAYIMSHLRKDGHDAKLFFDPMQFNRGYSRNKFLARCFDISENIIDELVRYNPDYVCFSVLTCHYQYGLEMAKRVRKVLKHTKIVFGGTHPTLVPEEVRKHDFIDEVVVGDGIEYFGGKFDPDKIYPAREDFLNELPPEHRRVQLFMTHYGCPFNCTFCGNEQMRKVGFFRKIERDVDKCIEELQMLMLKGMEYVLFVDDIFTMNKLWTDRFLGEYKVFVDLPFTCFGHVNALDEDRIKWLKDAGCEMIWLGIQSGDEMHRKKVLNRHETNEKIIEVCGLIKKYGIKLMVDHICGLPLESDISHELSYNLYSVIKPDVVNVYELLYFPKAKINEYALKCGYLKKEDIQLINEGKHIVYQQGNRGQHFYNKFAKGFVSIPLGGVVWEFLPLWLLKLIVHLRAGRAYIIRVMIQNELYFTWKAIKKKAGALWK